MRKSSLISNARNGGLVNDGATTKELVGGGSGGSVYIKTYNIVGNDNLIQALGGNSTSGGEVG